MPGLPFAPFATRIPMFKPGPAALFSPQIAGVRHTSGGFRRLQGASVRAPFDLPIPPAQHRGFARWRPSRRRLDLQTSLGSSVLSEGNTNQTIPAEFHGDVDRTVQVGASAVAIGHPHHHAQGWNLLHALNKIVDAGLGTVLLMAATAISLFLANNPSTAGGWTMFWEQHVGPMIGEHQLTRKAWINEGLMSLFFFHVGLEIKKELVVGSLSCIRTALLPCFAALGGMIIPMMFYIIPNLFPGGILSGWSVPMATDIAFAMGVYSVFKSRMPASVSPFLLTLATVDDLGAIVVIALAFSKGIQLPFLLLAGGITAILTAMSRRVSTRMYNYAVCGVLLWYFLLRSGVNADVAGVITALAVPATRGYKQMKQERPRKQRDYAIVADANLVESMAHKINPLSSLVIMPLFALANTAVPIVGAAAATTAASATTTKATLAGFGVAMGLLLGKPIGIVGMTLAAIRARLGSLPIGMTMKHLSMVGMLGSIGFTMSIFLAEAALSGAAAHSAKVGIFIASLAASISASVYMSTFPKPQDKGGETGTSLASSSTN
ncbi:hypothetical protein AAMO2058_000938800 [Amorphochlora amoebiformis]